MSRAEAVKDQIPLEALIGKYVALAKNGREFEALCPFHKEKSPSFRVVPDKGFFHCLAAETRVITWDGTTEIAALAGSVAKVLTRGGKWVDAKFQSYGTQRLFRVCLSRNGVRKTIFSTSGHRWFARGRNKDLTTVDLRPGYRLEAVIPERRREWIIDPEGVRHGIVYGDGTLQNGIYGHVNLHGEHKIPLSAWFSDFNPKIRTTSNGEPYIKVYGGRSFSHMKHLPSKDASPAYLLGFLAGYIAADGHVAKDGTVMLHSSERSNLEWVRDIATRLGVSTFGITHADRKGYLDHEMPIYRLHFVSSTLHPSLFLKTMAHARYVASNKRFERLRWSVVSIEETDRVEEVYCAEVPVEHAFVLEDNLLSGNCFGCGEHGDAIDFVMRFHGVPFKEALAIMGGDNVEPLSTRPRQQRAPVVDLYAGFEPILPVPADIPPILTGQRTPKILNPKRADDPDKRLTSFKPSLVHPYHAADGTLTGYVLRVDMGDRRKITPAIMWCNGPDGPAWAMHHFPEPRGLYGAHLLASSPKAVVILVEGEKAADAARVLFPKVIVLTWAGGSNAATKTDWTPLAGRKVALWPDADEPGIKVMLQIGAILAGLCCTITIADTEGLSENFDAADLPADTDGPAWLKPRLRAFVPPHDVPPDIIPHAEQDDRDYTSEPPPSAPSDDAPGGPVPLGYNAGHFYYLSRADGQVHSLTPQQHNELAFMGLASKAYYWERTRFQMKSSVDWKGVADFMMQACRDVGIFDMSRIRGRGAFFDGGSVVLHLGDRLVVDGVPMNLTSYASRYVYPANLPMNFPMLAPLPTSRASKVRELCDMLTLEQSYMSILLAGWIVIAPVCGALWWRPHVWISGPKGSGKSYVMREIIPPLCGGIAYNIDGKSTEAGVRQSLSSDARPVVFDEAESDQRNRDRVQSIIDLSRYASSENGARIVKGSTSGVSHEYIIRSCFAFASINTGLHEAADESRTVSIRFRPNTADDGAEIFEAIKSATADVTDPQFVGGLLSRTLSLIPIIRENAKTFSRAIRERYGDQRQGDTIGTLISGAYSLHSSAKLTLDEARTWIGDREWVHQAATETSAEDDDHDRILAHLMEQQLKLQHSQAPIQALIRMVVNDDNIEAEKVLRYHGIKIEGKCVLINAKNSLLTKIMFDTQWSRAWASTLLQSPHISRRKTQKKIGNLNGKPIEIPLSLIMGDWA